MLKLIRATWFGFTFVLATGIAVQAAQATSDDILVTNPDTLEAMGFERDANNVYAAPGVDLKGISDTLPAPVGNLDAHANLFPSGSVDYSPVSAKEFIGRADTTGTQWQYSTGNGLELSRLGTERFADAQVMDLPNGGLLQFLRWWWIDNDPNAAMAMFLFEVCQPNFAGGAISFTTLVANTSVDNSTGGSTAIGTSARPINNQSCYYLARVRFDAATTQLRFQKVRLQFNHP